MTDIDSLCGLGNVVFILRWELFLKTKSPLLKLGSGNFGDGLPSDASSSVYPLKCYQNCRNVDELQRRVFVEIQSLKQSGAFWLLTSQLHTSLIKTKQDAGRVMSSRKEKKRCFL